MIKPIILTGDRPTGKLHIGHYVGSLKNRVLLQEEDKYDMFVFLADQQALTDHAKDPQTIVESIGNVALDYLAVGLNPSKSTIFIQIQDVCYYGRKFIRDKSVERRQFSLTFFFYKMEKNGTIII